MRYFVQPRDGMFVKGYQFWSFAKNTGMNIVKSISKNLSGKYSPVMLALCQKILVYAK